MCTDPRHIRVTSKLQGTHWYKVPCGKCCECKKKYQNDWMVRMSYEATMWPKLCFVTLTYRDEDIPNYTFKDCPDEHYLTLHKKHVQDWTKAMRTDLSRKRGNDFKFKYFICGEYGTQGTKRPHYHGLFFGLSREDMMPYLGKWYNDYGIYKAYDIPVLSGKDVGCVTRYVAKYCSKGIFENPFVALGLVDPAFRLVSKGLGECYVSRYKDYHLCRDFPRFDPERPRKPLRYRKASETFLKEVIKRSHCLCGNYYYGLPKYYKTKIFYEKYKVTNPSNPSTTKMVYRASLLSREVTCLLYKMSCDLRDAKLQELCSSEGLTFSEALDTLDMREADALRRRDDDCRVKLAQFYSKSIF